MATAIEYGLIAAGISLAIVAASNGIASRSDWNIDQNKAAEACIGRPGETVAIKDWMNVGREFKYECSSWPRVFNPTLVSLK